MRTTAESRLEVVKYVIVLILALIVLPAPSMAQNPVNLEEEILLHEPAQDENQEETKPTELGFMATEVLGQLNQFKLEQMTTDDEQDKLVRQNSSKIIALNGLVEILEQERRDDKILVLVLTAFLVVYVVALSVILLKVCTLVSTALLNKE